MLEVILLSHLTQLDFLSSPFVDAISGFSKIYAIHFANFNEFM